jgi:hypothetical protein
MSEEFEADSYRLIGSALAVERFRLSGHFRTDASQRRYRLVAATAAPSD